MKAAAKQTDKYALGIVLFLAMVIGGGTRSGLVTDSIVEVLTILASAYVLAKPGAMPVSRACVIVAALALVAVVVQLVPLPSGLLIGMRDAPIDDAMASADSAFGFISLGVGQSLRSFLVLLSLVMFFLAVSRLRPDQVLGLLPFFFVGAACNLLAGAIQFSISDRVVIDDLLSYRITAGFFANINHFSALLFVTLPFLVYYGVIMGRIKVVFVAIVAILLVLLAAGSRAGVAIGIMILFGSAVMLSSRTRMGVGLLVVLFAGISVYGMGLWTRFDAEQSTAGDLRFEFIQTTWEGIKQNWLLGVGYGNFEQAYQIYERPDRIFTYFVNHAHNEYVQLMFEGGIIAVVLIVAYIVLLHAQLWQARDDGVRKMAYLAVIFLLVHSLVDYPLRTFALLMPFALFNAIFFYTGSFARRLSRERAVEVELDGEKVLVPVESAR